MYRVGEYVAVQDHQSEGTEWIVQFTALLVYGPVNNAYAHFFNGNYFAAKTLADGSVHKDGLVNRSWSENNTKGYVCNQCDT